MCIIIDINCLSNVFDAESQKHKDFKPILDWILNRNGKIVCGGTKYREELKKVQKYNKLLINLTSSGKVVWIEDKKVDQEQKKVQDKLSHRNFDDPHIVAIIIVSKCKLLCSNDNKSFEFIKNHIFYPKGVNKPLIYTRQKNEDLLCDSNISNCCK